MNLPLIEIYTDGSCHTVHNIGAWAAIIVFANDKIILKGKANPTTHNRMELLAVINAIDYAAKNLQNASLVIYTDSQYVSRIPDRKEKLKKSFFLTKKGTLLHNTDLVQILIRQIESHSIKFVKVKAHQPIDRDCINSSINLNSEVDKLARQIVREEVNNL